MVRPFSRWRLAVVGVCVGLVVLLAGLGAIGHPTFPEVFDAKQVTVWPIGGDAVRVREVVDEDFGSTDKHGYFRNIPNDFGIPTDVFASSPDASAEIHVTTSGPFGTTTRDGRPDRGTTVIRLGDAGTTIDGQHRYVLEYTLREANLSSGKLALDIIGTDETLSTKHFEVLLVGFTLNGATCSVGNFGVTGHCTLTESGGVLRAGFDPLDEFQGITVGGTIVSAPAFDEQHLPPAPPVPPRRTERNWPLALGAAAAGLLAAAMTILLMRRAGRDEVADGGAVEAAFARPPRGVPPPTADGAGPPPAIGTHLVSDDQLIEMATIEFAPPPGLEPWEGAALLTERVGTSTTEAWFAGLVARDALDLDKGDDDHLVLSRGPKFDRAGDADRGLVETMLGSRTSLALGTYDSNLAEGWRLVAGRQRAELVGSGWWRKLPASLRGVRPIDLLPVPVFVGAVILFAASFGREGSPTSVLAACTVGLGGAVGLLAALLAYRRLLSSRSAAGSALALRTESFRRFLAASEAKHVDWAWQHGMLREYTAWAMALGEAKAWGNSISTSTVPPNEVRMNTPWLIQTSGYDLHRAYTAPSSSGSGSGFSSGGGFSGGSVGGGGGGGSSGSW
jgi:hypothetical protein